VIAGIVHGKIFCEEHRSWCFSLRSFLHSPVTSSLLGLAPILEHPQPVFFLHYGRWSFTFVWNKKKVICLYTVIIIFGFETTRRHLKRISVCIIFRYQHHTLVALLKNKSVLKLLHHHRCLVLWYVVPINNLLCVLWNSQSLFIVFLALKVVSTFSTFCASFTCGYVTLLHLHGILYRILINLLPHATAFFVEVTPTRTYLLVLPDLFY